MPLSEMKLLNVPIGVFFFSLAKDHNSMQYFSRNKFVFNYTLYFYLWILVFLLAFVSWVIKFVDYHIRDLLKKLEKTHTKQNKVQQGLGILNYKPIVNFLHVLHRFTRMCRCDSGSLLLERKRTLSKHYFH